MTFLKFLLEIRRVDKNGAKRGGGGMPANADDLFGDLLKFFSRSKTLIFLLLLLSDRLPAQFLTPPKLIPFSSISGNSIWGGSLRRRSKGMTRWRRSRMKFETLRFLSTLLSSTLDFCQYLNDLEVQKLVFWLIYFYKYMGVPNDVEYSCLPPPFVGIVTMEFSSKGNTIPMVTDWFGSLNLCLV